MPGYSGQVRPGIWPPAVPPTHPPSGFVPHLPCDSGPEGLGGKPPPAIGPSPFWTPRPPRPLPGMTRHSLSPQLVSNGSFPSSEGCSWRNYSPRHPVWVTDGKVLPPPSPGWEVGCPAAPSINPGLLNLGRPPDFLGDLDLPTLLSTWLSSWSARPLGQGWGLRGRGLGVFYPPTYAEA